MTELHPRGTLRARFEALDPADAVFRRLGIGARRCDLGDQGLYLAEEIVAADRWLGGSDPEALGFLTLALMIALRQGSTRLPLDGPGKGQLRTLISDIVKLAALDPTPHSLSGSAVTLGNPCRGTHPGKAGVIDPTPHSLSGNAVHPERAGMIGSSERARPATVSERDVSQIMKRIANLTHAPTFNSVIGSGNARLPLVVDDGCLYSERMRYLEVRVAARLAARLSAAGPALAQQDLAKRPEQNLRAPSNADRFALTPEQRRAVDLALSGALTVVTGGPGTGKTRVAAAIVRGFADAGIAEVAVAAPTGKAANRLTEALNALSHSPGGRCGETRPIVAQTVHRLLGYRGRGVLHNANHPLQVGALIIDEASMIDLELIAAVLDAVPESAPLVLIGDAHQLPAIAAGRILSDLASLSSSGIDRVATLEHSHRMDAADPRGKQVLEAARAIRAGDGARLTERHHGLATPRTPGTLMFSGVEWVDAGQGSATGRAVASALWHRFDGARAQRIANETVFRFDDGFVDPEQSAALEALWTMINQARVLTVTRGLTTGAVALNAHLHELALERMTVSGAPEFVPGEPVMITANDHRRGLWNGDQGIIIRADEGLGHHRYRAVFRTEGKLMPFAIEALRDRLELGWALTIHKSQGSEFDAVAIVLPDDDLPLLTRELLYTGMTRARTSVVLSGYRAAIQRASHRAALRHSGLAGRIRANLLR